MKKHWYLMVLLLMAAMGCSNDASVSRFMPLERAEELALLYKGFYTKGTVNFSENPQGNLTGKIMLPNAKGNFREFTLQRQAGKSGEAPTSGEYEVLYVGNVLALNPVKEGSPFLLTLSESPEVDARLKEMPAAYQHLRKITGYGLSMTTERNAAGRLLTEVLPCAKAGGAGSVSCSNTLSLIHI